MRIVQVRSERCWLYRWGMRVRWRCYCEVCWLCRWGMRVRWRCYYEMCWLCRWKMRVRWRCYYETCWLCRWGMRGVDCAGEEWGWREGVIMRRVDCAGEEWGWCEGVIIRRVDCAGEKSGWREGAQCNIDSDVASCSERRVQWWLRQTCSVSDARTCTSKCVRFNFDSQLCLIEYRDLCIIIIVIIIIAVWLVQCRALPFLRACSRLDDSALDDRRLPDQCWVMLDRIQWSGATCDVVDPIGSSSPLAKGTHWP